MYRKLALSALLALTPALAYAAECPDLTFAQRMAGYLTLLNIAYGAGAVLVGGGIIAVFGGIIVQIISGMRFILEVLAYVAVGASFMLAWSTEPAYQLPYLMFGSLGFAGCVFLTIFLHDLKGDDPRGINALLLVVWAAVAIMFSSVPVGFLAVGALMSLLGFSIGVGPGYYAFGFERDAVMPRATSVALVILAGFVVQKLLWPAAPTWVGVFSPGAFWLSSFVAFTGMLIMSFNWYCRDQISYMPMQLLTVTVLCIALAVGLTFNIVPLPGMAGTFLVLFFASKSMDIDWETAIGYGFAMIFSGGVLIGAYTAATKNVAVAEHFLALVK